MAEKSEHPLMVVAEQFVAEDNRNMNALMGKVQLRLEQTPNQAERIQFLETRVANLIGLVILQTTIIAKLGRVNGG